MFRTVCLCLQASERIPLSLCGIHCSISILTWVAVAGLKGDYQLQVADTWFGGQRQAMFTAICSGAMTWVRQLEALRLPKLDGVTMPQTLLDQVTNSG